MQSRLLNPSLSLLDRDPGTPFDSVQMSESPICCLPTVSALRRQAPQVRRRRHHISGLLTCLHLAATPSVDPYQISDCRCCAPRMRSRQIVIYISSLLIVQKLPPRLLFLHPRLVLALLLGILLDYSHRISVSSCMESLPLPVSLDGVHIQPPPL